MRKTSYGSVTVFWLDREGAAAAVRAAARRLTLADPHVLRVILFGSLATGSATAASDVDLLIVLSESDVPLLDRPAHFADYFTDLGMPVDLFVYTTGELETAATRVAEHALATGIELV